MKQLIFTLLIFGIFTTASNAQFAAKAGVNLANISTNDDDVDLNSRLGFLLGVNYTTSISESFAFRPGLQFSMKGTKVDVPGDEGKLNFSYLDLPLDFVYSTGDLSFNLGPYLGLLLSATADGEDVKDQLSSLDYGLNVGAAYNVGPVSIGANYGLGFANLNSDNDDPTTVKNNVISLFVMYPF